jgi:hypothetical protein
MNMMMMMVFEQSNNRHSHRRRYSHNCSRDLCPHRHHSHKLLAFMTNT